MSLWEAIKNEHSSPRQLGWAVALGLFIGCLPVYGLHILLCLAVAWIFKLNKATVYLAANVSNPLLAPLIIAVGIAIGEWMRFGNWRGIDTDQAEGFIETVSLVSLQLPDLFVSAMLGDAVLGVLLAATIGPLVYLWARRRQEREALGEAS